MSIDNDLTPYKHTHLVLIISGHPGAGKDTLTNFLLNAAEDCGFEAEFVSSIEYVRDLLRLPVPRIIEKRPQDRKLLADVKAALDEHGEYSSTVNLLQRIQDLRESANSDPWMFLTHIREPDNAQKLDKALMEMSYHKRTVVARVWVSRPATDGAEQSCDSDKVDAAAFEPNFTVHNHSSISDLQLMARQLFRDLVAGSTHGSYSSIRGLGDWGER